MLLPGQTFIAKKFTTLVCQPSMIVWVQSVQAGQQPYKLTIDCEKAPRVNELMKAILKEECIASPTCYITIKTNKSGPKSHIQATLADLQPCGITSASPFWYILKCPGNYGNAALCRTTFTPKNVTLPYPILKRKNLDEARERQNMSLHDSSLHFAYFLQDLQKPVVSFSPDIK